MRHQTLLALTALALLVTAAGCGKKPALKPVATPAPIPVVEATPVPEEKPSEIYQVVRGDSLWKISGRPDIYQNPFQWPLIYRANRDQIQDPDLIYPGQDFTISRDYTEEELRHAIRAAQRTPRYQPHTKPRKRLPVEY